MSNRRVDGNPLFRVNDEALRNEVTGKGGDVLPVLDPNENRSVNCLSSREQKERRAHGSNLKSAAQMARISSR